MQTISPSQNPAAGGARQGPIAKQFIADDQDRQQLLDRARLCAALTKPWILPPQEQEPNGKLPQNYQSIGSRGIMTLEGKLLTALWPTDRPWFHLDLAPEIVGDPQVSAEDKQATKKALYLHELIIQASLETAPEEDRDTCSGAAAFRTAKRMSLSQLLITGDTLEQLTDDYKLKVYRRDQYVTRRNTAGQVLYHIVWEHIDPLTLSDKELATAQVPDERMKKPVAERMMDLYTRVEYHPRRNRWVVEQELNGETINKSEEKVSQFFSTPYELSPGEHYGRGFIELNLGDLSSLDIIGERELDFAHAVSKLIAALDYGSEVEEKDLEKPSGSVIRARVEGGMIQDIAFLNVNKTADFKVIADKAQRLRAELGAAMLIESELTPDKDRVTRFQAERVALEVTQAMGGTYAPISDYQHLPLLRRLRFQLTRDRRLVKLPNKAVQIQLVTGIAALSRANKANDLMTFIGALAQFPEAMKRVNQGVLLNVLARYQNINEPGLIYTEEEMAKQIQDAIAAQTQAAAGEQAVQSLGKIAENTVGNAQQQAAQPARAAA